MQSGVDEILLTAYALGELSGPQRAAVAAQLVANEEARRYVADVRATASVLSDQLARESYGGLNDLQHAAIEHRLQDMLRMPAARKESSHHGWKVLQPRRLSISSLFSRDHAMSSRQRMRIASIAAMVLIMGGAAAILLQMMYRQLHPAAGQQAISTKPLLPLAPTDPGTVSQPDPNDLANPFKPTPVALNPDPDSDNGPQVPWLPLPDDVLVMHGSDWEMAAPIAPAPVAVIPGRPEKTDPPLVKITPSVVLPQIPVIPDEPVPLHPRIPQKGADALTGTPHPSHPLGLEPSPSGVATVSDGEHYTHLQENPFIKSAAEPTSGFSAGVDTASYTNIRRFLTHGKLPPPDAVRIEEMLNYFPVRALPSVGLNEPAVGMQVEVGVCPWRPEHRLVRLCAQGREPDSADRPTANLVFLIDISDSMRAEGRLAMLKAAMRLLINKLTPQDHVTFITYSSRAAVVLPPTAVADKLTLWNIIDRLETVGQGKIVKARSDGPNGIMMAYELAGEHFLRGGTNRIILATDGGWNVGAADTTHLLDTVQKKSRDGVSLTVLGVGMSNLNDAMLQKLSLAGAGSYAYIDTPAEARRVLVDQVNGTLITRARHVKVQVSFNPATADSYRLIGYERRVIPIAALSSQSHHGGEIGAGQSITALYEVIPAAKTPATQPADFFTASLSYVNSATEMDQTIEIHADNTATPLVKATPEFRFAAAVAEFGLVLRHSAYKGNATFASAVDRSKDAIASDDAGYQQEFVNLVRKAKALAPAR